MRTDGPISGGGNCSMAGGVQLTRRSRSVFLPSFGGASVTGSSVVEYGLDDAADTYSVDCSAADPVVGCIGAVVVPSNSSFSLSSRTAAEYTYTALYAMMIMPKFRIRLRRVRRIVYRAKILEREE